VHVPLVALHAPLHAEKVDPLLGVALSVTLVPEPKLAEQVEGHSMAFGGWVLVTVPDPLSVTVSVNDWDPVTVVLLVAELFSAFGSGVVEVTLAGFVSTPAVAAVTTSVIVALALLFIVPSVQVTVVVPLHVPTVEVADTNVAPAGNTSVIVTAFAVSGPLLVTVIV
jgi:hypothetical protein